MLYKRGNKWWVRFSVRGREVRVTSGTDRKELAEEFEQQLREALWREEQTGEAVHTWEEACERWLKEKVAKRSLIRDEQAFASLRDYLGGRALVEIDPLLPELRTALAANRKLATVNRILAVLRSVVRAAVKWGWLTAAPQVELHAIPKQEPRWITPEQFEKLCEELPKHARPIARFAVATGLRSRNIYRLKWQNVDLAARRIHVGASEAKGGRSLGIPLSEEAVRVISGELGKHAEYVFTDQRGRAPIRSIKTCWWNATARAGIPDFRFHDLRHTWAAWHTLNGTPPIILKELGGWSSLVMVERYSHLNPGHLSAWAGNSVQKMAQPIIERSKVPRNIGVSRKPRALRMRRSTN